MWIRQDYFSFQFTEKEEDIHSQTKIEALECPPGSCCQKSLCTVFESEEEVEKEEEEEDGQGITFGRDDDDELVGIHLTCPDMRDLESPRCGECETGQSSLLGFSFLCVSLCIFCLLLFSAGAFSLDCFLECVTWFATLFFRKGTRKKGTSYTGRIVAGHAMVLIGSFSV